MHLLNGTILIAVATLITACTPRGAVTPEDAYYMLRKACRDGEGAAVERLLSGQSISRIASITRMLSSMENRQHEGVAKELGVSPDRLHNLTVKDFLSLQLKIERETGGKVLWPLVSRGVAKTLVKGNSATIITESGTELKLVREGPYWKFDQGIF